MSLGQGKIPTFKIKPLPLVTFMITQRGICASETIKVGGRNQGLRNHSDRGYLTHFVEWMHKHRRRRRIWDESAFWRCGNDAGSSGIVWRCDNDAGRSRIACRWRGRRGAGVVVVDGLVLFADEARQCFRNET